MKIKRRLERLEARLPPPDPEEALRQKRVEEVVDRFFDQLEEAAALLNPEEEKRVEQALVALTEDGGMRGPVGTWLSDLESGWSRLPKLPPAVMKDVLLLWLAPGVNGGVTCSDCGLEYPHRNYTPPAGGLPRLCVAGVGLVAPGPGPRA